MSNVIEDIVTEFTKVQKEFQTKAQNALRSAFKEFFDQNPRIQSVYWTQYTPYFNDGEECTFCVHDMYAQVGEWTDDDKGEYIEDRANTISSYGSNEVGYETEAKNFQEFTRLINKLPDEIFKQTFDDHAEITATREGFEVEEYQHD